MARETKLFTPAKALAEGLAFIPGATRRHVPKALAEYEGHRYVALGAQVFKMVQEGWQGTPRHLRPITLGVAVPLAFATATAKAAGVKFTRSQREKVKVVAARLEAERAARIAAYTREADAADAMRAAS